MGKPRLTINHSEFEKLHKKLKAAELKDPSLKIGDMPVSAFLMAHSLPEIDEPHDVAVKRIILQIAGDFSTDPSTLRESLKLKDNFQYRDNEYRLLQIRLHNYVKGKNKNASVTSDETNSCDKVGDCVNLVQGKLS